MTPEITNISDCISKINNIQNWMKNYVMSDHPIIKDAEDVVKFLNNKRVIIADKRQFDESTFFNYKTRLSVSLELNKIKEEQQSLSSRVLSIVSDIVGIPVNNILKYGRHKDIVEARFIYFWIIRNKYGFSFSLIGKFANKDHATVLYGVNKAEEWMVTRKGFKERIAKCINKLENEPK